MLQKGFFLTESHNPVLPPETWELVVEKTTPGTYSQTLGWGRYRFEVSAAGGGSGMAFGKNTSTSAINSEGSASGGAGAYGSFIIEINERNTDTFSLVVGAGGNGVVQYNGVAPTTGGGSTTISSINLGEIATLNGGEGAYAYGQHFAQADARVGNGGTFTTNLTTHNLNNGTNGISVAITRGTTAHIDAAKTTNPAPYDTGGFGGAWGYNGGYVHADNGGAGFVRIYKSNLKPEPV